VLFTERSLTDRVTVGKAASFDKTFTLGNECKGDRITKIYVTNGISVELSSITLSSNWCIDGFLWSLCKTSGFRNNMQFLDELNYRQLQKEECTLVLLKGTDRKRHGCFMSYLKEEPECWKHCVNA
jgi:hypothetical protein